MPESKEIQYLNKDFDSFKEKLIDFSKTYYPNTYNDFDENSPGLMLIEMASYVGDVLSFYIDNQVQENFVQYAKQRKNLLNLAYSNGYEPQVTNASTVDVEVFQLVPSSLAGGLSSPDFNYSMILSEGTQLQSSNNTGQFFYIENKIDFSISGSGDPTDISVYSLDSDNNPNFYLLKKITKATSGQVRNTTFTFGSPQKFPTVEVSDTNIEEIISVTDSDGNLFTEVPFLAQETVFEAQNNTVQNDPNFSQYNDTTPYLLKIKKVPRRFVKRFKTNNTLQLQFGSGISSGADEVIIPNPDNIGLGLPYGIDKLTTAFDPSNFLYTKTYGIAPSNTTITVQYLVGGGAESNIAANTLSLIASNNITFFGATLDSTLKSTVQDSLAFNNPSPAIGGGDGDTNQDLRENILSQYSSQLRTVTKEDYIIRSLSLHILSKDSQGNLTTANPAIKQNLKTYLAEYRLITDGINIRDAFIINIGVNFEIILLPNYNGTVVLNSIITQLTDYFNTDNYQINQPILLNNVKNLIDRIDGVQTVKKLELVNKTGAENGYSAYAYDMKGATINDILYPSLDPSIFELKSPNTDIQGRIVTN